MSRSALHSCSSPEHYTPPEIAVAVRRVLGAIDLDPCSSPAANATLGAARFYSDRGQERPWQGRCYVNAPGDRRGILVKAFWRRSCEHALYGGPGAAVLWAGYSLGPLPRLYQCESFPDGRRCPGPGNWPMVVVTEHLSYTTPSGRICWIDGRTGQPGRQPGHGNYFCLLGGDRDMRARFREVVGAIGEYHRPSPMGRDYEAEILAALCDGPLSKSAIARSIRGQKSRVLREVDRLALAGRISLVDGKFAVPGLGTVIEELWP